MLKKKEVESIQYAKKKVVMSVEALIEGWEVCYSSSREQIRRLKHCCVLHAHFHMTEQRV